MFGLLRNRRRRRILARNTIADDVWNEAVADLPVLAGLDDSTLARLRDLTLLFVEEKQIVGAGGLELEPYMRARIGALASLLVLELGFDWYDHIVTIIVYPDEFVVRDREVVDDAGVVHIGDDVLSGEAWDQGPVVLAWTDIEASGQGDGYNVVAHEFAHKLDLLSGAVDGMPPLHRGMNAERWSATFQAAYDGLHFALDRGEETWLDPYAAEEPAEFFAVCTELFFDTPDELADRYPAVYSELSAFFKQSPAETLRRSAARPNPLNSSS
ncbi:MAG TPA: M90 family metallopeptidase [Gammaproteobacteria bacterium]|nr:M90 family metallopeptidase [Gammaproteobacteria bacterium]